MAEWIFGHHAVTAALEAGNRPVEELYITHKNAKRYQHLHDSLKETKVFQTNTKELDKRFAGQVHQGIAAKVGSLPSIQLEDIVENAELILLLDQVTDPHNLGACLRSANAFGCDAVVVPSHNSATLNETAAKAAVGAAEVTPLIHTGNLNNALDLLKKNDFWIVGLDGYAEQSISDIDMKGKLAIVMGSEGSGLRDLVKKNCDFLAQIPMVGTVESLNVSVSTGVTLYEALKQRKS